MPSSAVPSMLRPQLSRTALSELVLGLLVGVVLGWVGGLVQVRRP